ncbi:MAG: hypothetical protein RLY14_3132 [Planctomycetota bacterium]|jgi:hypothetical protein
MSNSAESTATMQFVDRRAPREAGSLGMERRQFGNSYRELSEDAKELAEAIDSYKVRHRRRYITFEEMLQVITELGYKKVNENF